jgi:cytochrome c oxidase subunit IV
MAHATYSEKVHSYLKVFYYLLALTIGELAVVYIPGIPHLVMTLVVCFLSLLKAVCVGWWYMHLNHETKALKALAILPLFIAFFYAAYLVYDAPYRPVSPYIGEPARVFKGRAEHAPEGHAPGAAQTPSATATPATNNEIQPDKQSLEGKQ